jgi:hypothetical protein
LQDMHYVLDKEIRQIQTKKRGCAPKPAERTKNNKPLCQTWQYRN